MKGISLHSVVPVRTEARETAEMSTQILFAEQCEILAEQARWYQVRLCQDGQEGWVDKKMLTPLSAEEEQKLPAEATAMVLMPMAYAVSENNGQTIPLTAGTRLCNYKDGRFELLGVGFRIDPSMVLTAPLPVDEPHLLQAVRFFLNIPYLWGGKNAMGMDCSGFTQVVLSLFGKHLLRNASEQATQGTEVNRLENAQAGDLAFFCKPQINHANNENNGNNANNGAHAPITHVGILIDKQRIIHCSGRVKVEKIDATGIFSIEQADAKHPQGQYTHQLLSIRRY
ncbi:MAG: NlpC/P60 family protein [Paludibacteraceae bacterium]|nr:NlpC/P60 family protein [Paludibacteraceae bacterium]